MTDRERVYTKVTQKLKQSCKGQKQGHIATLSMMITGLLFSKKANLSKMAAEVPHHAKDKSTEKRMVRYVQNENIDVDVEYLPFARQLLERLKNQTLYISIDGSTMGRNCMALVAGVVYKKRSIPLSWLVYEGKKGHASVDTHIELVRKLQLIVPENTQVIILGDGEFDGVDFLAEVVNEMGWHFVSRTGSNIILYTDDQKTSYGKISLKEGERILLKDVEFTAERLGPLHAVLWWRKGCEKPLYLITSIDDANMACNAYSKRFSIETFFSDQKSRGFGLDKSHLSCPERLNRLLMSACLAFMWIMFLGMEVINRGWNKLIDRTERIDKSIFRLGMDWLTHCLKTGKDLFVEFFMPYQKSVR